MDYKERYIAALERAKKLQETCDSQAVVGWCEYIFPELKELWDERIKREILELVSIAGNGNQFEEIKDWLEKQGKQKVSDSSQTCKMETLMTLDEAIEHCKGKSCDNTLCSKEHKQLAEWLTELKGYRVSVTRETQNPADKLEPKFHEGNWVLNNVCPPVQIASIKGSMYIFTEGDAMPVSFVDENYHLWTIEDAKNGDVLATWSGAFIYNGKRDGISCPGSYCGINTLGRFQIGGEKHWTGKKVYPATKEQRDTLFAKMKEAGWEWNAEQKEANKIEQKPVDKVESKFRVGNWYQCTKDFFGKGVTFDKNTAYYCAKEGCLQNEYGCHIAIVKDLYDNFKLWSIEDAKDGDVLSINWYDGNDSWEKIIIFKKYHNKGVKGVYYLPCVEGYGNTFKNGKLAFQEEVPYYSETWTANLHPATKEQRDTLIKAMANAGYTFDFEKKELKKKLDPDKVIAWLNDQACQGWIEDVEVDKFVAKFKQDFGL